MDKHTYPIFSGVKNWKITAQNGKVWRQNVWKDKARLPAVVPNEVWIYINS